ncbi:thiamine phosphate synthase [Microbacterium protaetiae]|uniref:Thiamine-phosphate synthase n=1 Tax=Microbacterium protaetiae TaxID=2509458 RepID=A0A4P6EKQ3_9MICO|nr:thiamine phosphate synthase [Microbacterium protaetiae]QAY60737.1 thiamine phosphate synthase [Microbacterium protaetiae]
MNGDLSVYLVTDAAVAAAAGHDVAEVVAAAARGGAGCVQVREKHAPARDFLATVLRICEVVPPGMTVLVNDRIDVYLAARAAGARVAGVHVGQSDLPARTVRQLIGTGAVLGVSASTPEQLARAAADGASYVGVGALHATTTKPDAPAPLGHDAFAALVRTSTLPAVAIGGVTVADVPLLRAAGAAGAAVVSAVCGAGDPEQATRALRTAWEQAR